MSEQIMLVAYNTYRATSERSDTIRPSNEEPRQVLAPGRETQDGGIQCLPTFYYTTRTATNG